MPDEVPAAFPTERCPLCHGPNGCAMAACASRQAPSVATPCWCTQARFSDELLARVPPQARHRACICAGCVGQAADAYEAAPLTRPG